MQLLNWEEIELPAGKLPGVGKRTRSLRMFRTPAPGGWLVLTTGEQMQVVPSIAFVPDGQRRWSGTHTELEAAEAPGGRGTELEASGAPLGRGTELESVE